MSRVSLSFCGCGFLGLYHVGVVSCLVKHAPAFLAGVERVAGASAGSLIAALVVTSPTVQRIEISKEMIMSMVHTVRGKPLGALTPGYKIAADLEKFVDKMLPPDAHKVAKDRLFVSLTNVRSKQNEIVSHFDTREDLVKTLMASCHIPVYSGTPFLSLKGQTYCDGGLTNNMIRFMEGRTVTVSPFSGQQDISPQDPVKHGTKPVYFNLRNHIIQMNTHNALRFQHAFFPPTDSTMQEYFEIGMTEAKRFLTKEGLCEESQPQPEDSDSRCINEPFK